MTTPQQFTTEVLIVSRTKMKETVCVGAIEVTTFRPMRLKTRTGGYQPSSATYNVGEVYEIVYRNYNPKHIVEPHNENVYVDSHKFVRLESNLKNFLSSMSTWNGSVESLFDGKMRATLRKSLYVNRTNGLPAHSTGFWVPDKSLRMVVEYDSTFYIYPSEFLGLRKAKIKFVGTQDPINLIPAGTLLRVSLSTFFKKPNSNDEEACWLQLSGWYL